MAAFSTIRGQNEDFKIYSFISLKEICNFLFYVFKMLFFQLLVAKMIHYFRNKYILIVFEVVI